MKSSGLYRNHRGAEPLGFSASSAMMSGFYPRSALGGVYPTYAGRGMDVALKEIEQSPVPPHVTFVWRDYQAVTPAWEAVWFDEVCLKEKFLKNRRGVGAVRR
jgi:hypothetical protein